MSLKMRVTQNQFKKFEKQIILKKIGLSGQKKIFSSKVLVVGVGGLGCPLITYLAASGVGKIGILDFDKIEISTHHFKGNFPSHCSLQAAYISSKKSSGSIVQSSNKWKTLMKKTSLKANKRHVFKNKLMKNDKINFIKINIFRISGLYNNFCEIVVSSCPA